MKHYFVACDRFNISLKQYLRQVDKLEFYDRLKHRLHRRYITQEGDIIIKRDDEFFQMFEIPCRVAANKGTNKDANNAALNLLLKL